MIDKNRLAGAALGYGIHLSAEMLDRLDLYAQILVEYNEKVNLTAITDPYGIEIKHFLDSLLFANCPFVAGNVVDVGTGAGFPGIVTKIFKPEIRLTLMEPTGKRCDFLRFALSELGLEAEILKERAEEAARKQWRDSFDVATARAVAQMRVLLEYGLPLVKTGGYFIPMKGDSRQETARAAAAANKLRGKHRETFSYTLPEGGRRDIVVFEKLGPTPKAFPRNGGKIAKKPL